MALAVPVWWEGHEIAGPIHGVGSAGVWEDAGVGMILSARVGLDMRYEICELHVALAVPACELWSSVPRLDYSSLDAGSGSKILRTSQQSPGWIVFPDSSGIWKRSSGFRAPNISSVDRVVTGGRRPLYFGLLYVESMLAVGIYIM
ncbi:unnamed protein product [Prunus armeniaca]